LIRQIEILSSGKPDWYWQPIEPSAKQHGMGRLIPFYVPDAFKQKVKLERGSSEPAKVIQFRPAEAKKPA
jgi:hypothetical protein